MPKQHQGLDPFGQDSSSEQKFSHTSKAQVPRTQVLHQTISSELERKKRGDLGNPGRAGYHVQFDMGKEQERLVL